MFRGWQVPAVAVFCGAVFFWNLGDARLWDRDEPRNAGCAAEMLAADNWIVPVFNDQLRHLKPALTYWLMMSAYLVFGVSEFSARFWSAVLGVASCLITWRIGYRLFDNRTGILAALILPGTVMYALASRAATPDAPLIFCFSATILLFVETAKRGRLAAGAGQPAWRLPTAAAIGLYALVGLGALAKGLAGVIPPLATIGLFLMIRQGEARRREAVLTAGNRGRPEWLNTLLAVFSPRSFFSALVSMRPVVGAVVILAVAGPWFVAVGQATDGEFLRLFFVKEHLVRATQPMEGHSGGPWFYPLAVLAGFFPWSVFAVPVAVESWRSRSGPQRISVDLLLAWVAVEIGIFSLASTKLPSYVTPCYPALALLTANSLLRFSGGLAAVGERWYRLGLVSAGLAGLAVTLGLYWAADNYLGGHRELSLIGLPVVGTALFCGWRLAGESRFGGGPSGKPAGSASRGRWILPWAFAMGAGLFCLGLFGMGAGIADSVRQTDPLFEAIRRQNCGTHIASYRCLESSWVVYGGRPIVELALPGESGGKWSDKQEFWQYLPRLNPDDFAVQFPDSMILTTSDHLAELQSRLPRQATVVSSTPDFLRDRRLVLVSLVPPQRTAESTGRDPNRQ